jgi:hypothetical protein
MLQRLWFSLAFARRSLDFFNQSIDTVKDLSVGSFPVEIIFPGMFGENPL